MASETKSQANRFSIFVLWIVYDVVEKDKNFESRPIHFFNLSSSGSINAIISPQRVKYCEISNISCTKSKNKMFLFSSCSCLCALSWSHVFSREWRYSWSSAGTRCCNYIYLINNFITHLDASYVRDLTVVVKPNVRIFPSDDTCDPHSWQDILSVPFLWSDKNDSLWYIWHLEYIWLRPPASSWIQYLFSISSFQWCVTSCMFFIHKHVYTANRFRCVTTTCLSDFVFSWSRANSIEQWEKDNCAIEGREIQI